MDQPAVLYFLMLLSSIYGFFLFAWGWIRYRTHTAMYIYIMLLFLAFIIMEAFNLYARLLRFSNIDFYFEFMATPIWSIRLYITLFVITIIPIHMTIRAIRGKIKRRAENET